MSVSQRPQKSVRLHRVKLKGKTELPSLPNYCVVNGMGISASQIEPPPYA